MNIQLTSICVLVLVTCDNIIFIATTIGYRFGIFENSYITVSIVHDEGRDVQHLWNMRRLLLKTGVTQNSPTE